MSRRLAECFTMLTEEALRPKLVSHFAEQLLYVEPMSPVKLQRINSEASFAKASDATRSGRCYRLAGASGVH